MNYIRHFRRKIGISQIELATKIGLTPKTIFRWEKGECEPRMSDLKKLCEVLHCTENELLNGTTKPELHADVKEATVVTTLTVKHGDMSITFTARDELWKDDEAVEDLIQEFLAKRMMGLRNYEEGWT